MSYCLKCTALLSGDSQFCSKCGQDQCETVPAHHMKPGTLLEYRYWVGKALGEGGFGITYIGRDTKLDMTVAIKEYYPNGYDSRSNTISAAVENSYSADRKDFFEKGRERFLKEARILARFAREPGVVNVRDFFEQNNTAYIVMEYLDGLTLKEYSNKNGTMPAQQVLQLLMPTMQVLQKIHAMDLIHRDISPDNIMLINGKVKLLDFGAARDVTAVGNKSLSVMLKPGYAPEEQYRSRGIQGPWTDVYAISATIYKCITGITPDDSTQRVFCDEVKTPSELGIKIDPSFEAALMKGMAVSQKDRYQSIGELLDGLNGADPVVYETESRAVQENSEETVCIFDDDTVENSQTVLDAPITVAPEDSSDALPVFIPVVTNDGETVAIETEDDLAETKAPSIDSVENTQEEDILESTEYDAPVMSEQELDRENGEDIPEEIEAFADSNDEITLGGTAVATADAAEDDIDDFDDIQSDDVDGFFDYDSKNEESEGYYNKYGEFIPTETSVETEQAKLPENKHRKVIAIGILLLFVLFIFVIVFTSCEPEITREDIILYDSNGNIVDEINMAPDSAVSFDLAFADEDMNQEYYFDINCNNYPDISIPDTSSPVWYIKATNGWTGTAYVEVHVVDKDKGNVFGFRFEVLVDKIYASEDLDTSTEVPEQSEQIENTASGSANTTTSSNTSSSTASSKPSNTVSTVTSKPSSTTSETVKKVTVNFDSNGGTACSAQSVTVGGTYGKLPEPTKTGYSFNGWYTSSSGGTEVTSSTVVSTKTNHTLYAQWSVMTYTLTLDANGGSIAVADEERTKITRVLVCNEEYGWLPSPRRDGWCFEGWFTAKKGGISVDGNDKMPANDVTLYARWAWYP